MESLVETIGGLAILAAYAAAWLVPSTLCLLKGKLGFGLTGLLGPVAATLLAIVATVGYFAVFQNGADADGYEDLGVAILAFLLGMLVWIGVIVTSFVVSLIGAIRLAKPTSGWARRYDPAKLARAQARFTPRVTP